MVQIERNKVEHFFLNREAFEICSVCGSCVWLQWTRPFGMCGKRQEPKGAAHRSEMANGTVRAHTKTPLYEI